MLQTDSRARVLTREECLALLPTVPVGRVVFTDRAMPAIVPVNFVVDGHSIVIRTGATSTLAAALRGAVVAFEVDDFTHERRTGWSVTALGRPRQVVDPVEFARLDALPFVSYTGVDHENIVVIPVELVSGRQVGPPVAV